MMRATTILCLLTLLGAHALPVGADAWRSPGKRGGPLVVASDTIYRAAVGETVEVPLRLTLDAPADWLRVEVIASEGLLLEAPRIVRRVEGTATGPMELEPVRATPQAGGRHYLGVTVFAGGEGRERFRSFSIAVESGEVARAKASGQGRIEVDASGRPVHVLPAREGRSTR